MTTEIANLLQRQIGQPNYSDWLVVDQEMIDRFAETTGDRQFIHIDPARAAATHFGGTVAHGFLLLSLLPVLHAEARKPVLPNVRMGINYGFDRIRFVHPVRSGSRIRGCFTPVAVEEKRPRQYQQLIDVVVEIEGADKPALVALWIGQFLT